MFDPEQLPVPDLGFVCRGCGYPLAGLNQWECPECGRPFTLEEFIPRGGFPLLIAGGEPVRATDEMVDLLELYQIPYIAAEDALESALGGVSLGSSRRRPPIAVPREQYLEAVDLVRRLRLDEPLPDPPLRRSETEWTCPGCGEQNPANFDICWNCGEPADPE
ncbi:MAG: hypothetical protein ACLFV3_08715 [Phycisphaeraceae bacterium]